MKMKKYLIQTLTAVSLVVCMFTGIKVQAAKTTCTVYSGRNVESQNYSRYSTPIDSYLAVCQDGSLMRLQYGSRIGGVLVEYYDKDYNIDEKRSRILPQELPIFGGFYETASHYLLVTGQNNSQESPDVEVYRITKYDKSWNRIASAGLYDCNTTIPFDAGSLRMDVSGKYLLIRTSHEMYQSDDGYNHQANVTIQVDLDSMKITDSYTKVMNGKYGYISHSFNQFIKLENNQIVALDHGDAYPRSLALVKYKTDISTGKFTPTYQNPCTVVPVMSFPGETGENTTGASAGGFEISDTSYLAAGNSVVQDENNLSRKTRNIFVAAVDKSSMEVKTNWITDYAEGDGTTSTPQLVKLAADRFLLLWSRDNTVYYTELNGKGEKTGSIFLIEGNLSDCTPIVSEGKVIWYTWENGKINFYDISLDNLQNSRVTKIENGHRFVNKGVENGYANLECSQCGEKEQKPVATSITCWWNEDGGSSYFSSFPSEKMIEEKIYYWIQFKPGGSDSEMEVVSSDPAVAEVTRSSSGMGYLTMKKPGQVSVTVRPRLNPEVSKSFTLTVSGNLTVESFTASPAQSACVDSQVTLSARASGGKKGYQYKFTETDQSGNETLIRDYAAADNCLWTPQTTGTRTLRVAVKDQAGTEEEMTIENYQVVKNPSPGPAEIKKMYSYAAGAELEQVDLMQYLPENLKAELWAVRTEDSRSILAEVAVDQAGLLTYQVKDTGAVGDTAEIRVTVSSENYESAIVTVIITLTEKEIVSEKPENPVSIMGSNQLVYGQKLSALRLSSDAVFVTAGGMEVKGVLSWTDGELIPAAGTILASWSFRPENEEAFAECSGSLSVEVLKAEPEVTAPEVPGVSYHPERTLANLELTGGSAQAEVGGVQTEIPGIWSFAETDITPQAGRREYDVIFSPEDASNYRTVQTKVTVSVSQAVPTFTSLPTASVITYGTRLGEAVLSGGKVVLDDIPVEGTWHFKYPETYPEAGDAQATAVFEPKDSVNYHQIAAPADISVEKAIPEIAELPSVSPLSLGDSLSRAVFAGGKVMAGDLETEGSWRFQEEDTVPPVGKQEYRAVFTPADTKNCMETTAVIGVSVEGKQIQIEQLPKAGTLVYGQALKEAGLSGGKVLEGDTIVSGTWSFRNPMEILLAGSRTVEVIFSPEDEALYQSAAAQITVRVKKAVPRVIGLPKAGQISYGQTLKDVALSGGRAEYNGQNVPGQFFFADSGVKPSVKDSGRTGYELLFQPADGENYERVSCGQVKVTVSCTNHQYQGTLTRVPTAAAEGIMTYTCKICQKTYTQRIAKLLPEVRKNQTGVIKGLKYKVTRGGKSKTAQVSVTGMTGKKKRSVVIPATVKINGVTCRVTGIGPKAFYRCKKLKKITIKSTELKTVGKNALKGIDKKAVIKVPKRKLKAYRSKFKARTGFQKSMKITK